MFGSRIILHTVTSQLTFHVTVLKILQKVLDFFYDTIKTIEL